MGIDAAEGKLGPIPCNCGEAMGDAHKENVLKGTLCCGAPPHNFKPLLETLHSSEREWEGRLTPEIRLHSHINIGDGGDQLSIPAPLKQVCAQLLPVLRHVLAVTAPRSVELDEPVASGGTSHRLGQVFKGVVGKHLFVKVGEGGRSSGRCAILPPWSTIAGLGGHASENKCHTHLDCGWFCALCGHICFLCEADSREAQEADEEEESGSPFHFLLSPESKLTKPFIQPCVSSSPLLNRK